MPEKLKSFLVIAGKNAVNAVLTNAALMTMLHGAFNVPTSSGWWDIGKTTLAVVLSREAIIWGPKLLKWSSSGTN